MNKPLKILVIAPTPFFSDRGSHVRILEECLVLKNAGHEVQLVTYGFGRDIEGVNIKRTVHFPWYKKISAGPSWHKIYVDIFLFITSLKKAISFKPDVIHCHLHEGCLIGWAVGKLSRIPFVFDYQGGMTAEMGNHKFLKPGSFIFKLFYKMENFIDNLPKNIFTSSKMGKDELIDNFKLPEKNIFVLSDGVGEVNTKTPTFNLKKKFNIPPENKVIIYVGILCEYQGIDLLLKGIAENKKKLEKVTFLMFGFPEEKYKAKAQDLGISNVIFPGKLPYEELYECLGQADFAIAPKISTTEANGKVYNYMAAGLPVVLFDSSINREIIGDDGVYAKFGDKNDLIKQIINLAGTPCRKKSYKLKNDIFWSSRLNLLEKVYSENLTERD